MAGAGVVFAKDRMVNYGGTHRGNKVSSNKAVAQRLCIVRTYLLLSRWGKRTVIKRGRRWTMEFLRIRGAE